MLIDHCRERTANAILFFTARAQQCTKTRLMHMLYLFDFEHFTATGRSVTDQAYCALPCGPAPAELYWALHRPAGTPSFLDTLVEDTDPTAAHSVLLPKKTMGEDDLTRRQLTLLDKLAETYGDDLEDALARAVCAGGTPWHKVYRAGHGAFGHIAYDLVLDGLPQRERILELAQEHCQFRRTVAAL